MEVRTIDWTGQVSASLLDSTNRNDLAGTAINRTRGTRRTLDAQVEHRFKPAESPNA